jgi:hypothetical protein
LWFDAAVAAAGAVVAAVVIIDVSEPIPIITI